MNKRDLVSAFRDCEQDSRDIAKTLLRDAPGRPSTVGKHEAKNVFHLEKVLKMADATCPEAADTLRWLLWHNVLRAQWYLHMAEMVES